MYVLPEERDLLIIALLPALMDGMVSAAPTWFDPAVYPLQDVSFYPIVFGPLYPSFRATFPGMTDPLRPMTGSHLASRRIGPRSFGYMNAPPPVYLGRFRFLNNPWTYGYKLYYRYWHLFWSFDSSNQRLATVRFRASNLARIYETIGSALDSSNWPPAPTIPCRYGDFDCTMQFEVPPARSIPLWLNRGSAWQMTLGPQLQTTLWHPHENLGTYPPYAAPTDGMTPRDPFDPTVPPGTPQPNIVTSDAVDRMLHIPTEAARTTPLRVLGVMSQAGDSPGTGKYFVSQAGSLGFTRSRSLDFIVTPDYIH